MKTISNNFAPPLGVQALACVAPQVPPVPSPALRRHPGIRVDEKQDLELVANRFVRGSMLAFTPERSRVDFRFKDYGVTLYALTPLRLKTLEGGHFSYREDPRLANTLLRPTLFKSLSLEAAAVE